MRRHGMRRILIPILSLMLPLSLLATSTSSAASATQRPSGPGVLSVGAMPGRWQPSRDAPWSEREGRDAKYAIRIGLNEVIHFYQRRPAAVRRLDEDSVASLIEVTYASANPPSLDATARAAARRNLTILMAPYLRRNSGRCDEYEQLLPLAIFAGAGSSHVRIASPEVAKVVRPHQCILPRMRVP